MVPVAAISDPKNDFNLNLPRYIDSTEPEDLQDIDGHLRGGVPSRDIDALERYWRVLPSVRTALFKRADRPGYSQLRVAAGDVNKIIFGHAEFAAFSHTVTALFGKWRKTHAPRLRKLAAGSKPKELIEVLSEDLLATFEKAHLLDPYDVYQRLMDYWAETMQDDAYIISASGWVEGARVRQLKPTKNKEGKTVWAEVHDFMVGKNRFKSDLIPSTLLIARYFTVEQAAVEATEAELAVLQQQIEERIEEQGGEGGLLEDVVEGEGEKRKITAKAVKARRKEIGGDTEFADEARALDDYTDLLDKQAAVKKRLKTAQEALEAKIAAKYGKLTEEEIKTLVVDDKWLVALGAAVQGELDRVSQVLTGRIRQLAERYAIPLPKLTQEVESIAARVEGHLKKMGAVWD
jgi:type I restriction enzyme M protein